MYKSIDRYYSGKIRTHGSTPLGVDWTCVPTQQLRFVQLLKVCDFSRPLSLNDFGCGYGGLLALLAKRHPRAAIDYLGVDLSTDMVAAARALWKGNLHATFVQSCENPRIADYSVASGIFNVKLTHSTAEWTEFIQHTLHHLHGTSSNGFAVNFLAHPVAGQAYIPELFYAEPAKWLQYCEENLHACVELLDNYGMPEFTILVRRS